MIVMLMFNLLSFFFFWTGGRIEGGIFENGEEVWRSELSL